MELPALRAASIVKGVGHVATQWSPIQQQANRCLLICVRIDATDALLSHCSLCQGFSVVQTVRASVYGSIHLL